MQILKRTDEEENLIEKVSLSIQLLIGLAKHYDSKSCLSWLFETDQFKNVQFKTFISAIYEVFEMNPNSIVLAFVYIHKLMSKFKITMRSIHYFFVLSCLIAQKFYNDNFQQKGFRVVMDISSSTFSVLEKLVLDSLNWRLLISQDEFSQYESFLKSE